MACADSCHGQPENAGGRDIPAPPAGWLPEESRHGDGQSTDPRRLDAGDHSAETTPGYESAHPRGWRLANDVSTLSQLVEGLRTGRITSRQAAEQLEAYRDSRESPPPGTSSETVRIQDAADGRLWFERDTPENDEDRPGERTAVGESEAISRRQRQLIMMVRSVGSGIPSTEKFVNNVQQGLTAYVSADPQQRTSGTQETNPPANPPSADFDAGDAMSATLTAIVATVVLGQRAAEKLHSPRKPKPRASRAPGSDRGGNVPENGTGRPRLRWFVRRAPRAAKLSARSE